MALRAARPREPDLFGRKVADILWAVYGAAGGSARRPRGKPEIAGKNFIGWAETTQGIRAARWLAEHVPREAVVYRSSSILNQLVAVKAGMGLAVLPCYLGDPEAGLSRFTAPVPDLTTELWLITHQALKESARVRAFMEIVGDGVRKALPRLVRGPKAAGEVPASPLS